MHTLKIINSSDSRIITQCTHCKHVMRTPADALYYLVECPMCFKDFIAKRYSDTEVSIPEQVRQVSAKVSTFATPTNLRDDTFIRAVHSFSWPVYKFTLASCLLGSTIAFGLRGDIRILIWSMVGLFVMTILHYLVLCAGAVYFRSKEHLDITD
jgi:hypothetical protein